MSWRVLVGSTTVCGLPLCCRDVVWPWERWQNPSLKFQYFLSYQVGRYGTNTLNHRKDTYFLRMPVYSPGTWTIDESSPLNPALRHVGPTIFFRHKSMYALVTCIPLLITEERCRCKRFFILRFFEKMRMTWHSLLRHTFHVCMLKVDPSNAVPEY